MRNISTMVFYLELEKGNRGYRFTICGKNKTNSKKYLTCEFGNRYDKQKNNLDNLSFFSNWYVKNSQWKPKNEIVKRDASFDKIYAERSLRLYSGSFAVIIDFINTQNQIMYHGLGKIGTQTANKFDWIRIRRSDYSGKKLLKNKPFSAFFKLSEIEKFFKSEKSKIEDKKTFEVRNGFYIDSFNAAFKTIRMKPTFTTLLTSDEQILDEFSKYLKNNEELVL